MTRDQERWNKAERDAFNPPSQTVDTAQERLSRLRLHAKNIKAMTSSDGAKDASGGNATNVRTWRALVITAKGPASLMLVKADGKLQTCVVTRAAGAMDPPIQPMSNQSGLHAVDIAVFFGLDAVDPADVQWEEVSVRTPSQLFIAQGSLGKPTLN